MGDAMHEYAYLILLFLEIVPFWVNSKTAVDSFESFGEWQPISYSKNPFHAGNILYSSKLKLKENIVNYFLSNNVSFPPAMACANCKIFLSVLLRQFILLRLRDAEINLASSAPQN
jgi:hypothetical protein